MNRQGAINSILGRHGFVCICQTCARAARPLKAVGLSQWHEALSEAQREQRAYSWFSIYSKRSIRPT